MRVIGSRIKYRIHASLSAKALKAGAALQDIASALAAVPTTGTAKGLYRFRSHGKQTGTPKTPKPARSRGAKSLYDRARKYIGAVKKPLKPHHMAARAKALVRGIIAAKHPR
jgi:hypothetical protein